MFYTSGLLSGIRASESHLATRDDNGTNKENLGEILEVIQQEITNILDWSSLDVQAHGLSKHMKLKSIGLRIEKLLEVSYSCTRY